MAEAMDFPKYGFWNAVLGVLYPPMCELCGEERLPAGSDYLCETCRAKIRVIDGPRCLMCGRTLMYAARHEGSCPGCRNEKYETSTCQAACVYEGAIKDLLHAFKYGRKIYLKRTLANVMRGVLAGPVPFSGVDGIVPVPMVRGRWLDRGFNQAGEIAAAISSMIHCPLWNDVLKRIHHREPQALLNRRSREENIKDAFRIKLSRKVQGKTVLLVDDILTTGSTANECARVLKKAGAKDVKLFVVARGL